MPFQNLKDEVSSYYTDKLGIYGTTHRGVDWNSEASQVLRFDQLLRAFNLRQHFSLNDLGCGYGALCDYLQTKGYDFTYAGCDLSDAMIQAARQRFAASPTLQFIVGDVLSQRDYT